MGFFFGYLFIDWTTLSMSPKPHSPKVKLNFEGPCLMAYANNLLNLIGLFITEHNSRKIYCGICSKVLFIAHQNTLLPFLARFSLRRLDILYASYACHIQNTK